MIKNPFTPLRVRGPVYDEIINRIQDSIKRAIDQLAQQTASSTFITSVTSNAGAVVTGGAATFDLGGLGTGLLKQTVTAGIATPAIAGVSDYIAPGRAAGGDLAGTYPNPTVAAVHETSGPTQLTITTIPLNTPFSTVLVRPSGGAILEGISSDVLIPDFAASGSSHRHGLVIDPGSTAGTSRYLREDATWTTPAIARTVEYFLNGVNPISSPGYAATSISGTLSSVNIPYPLGVAASNVRLMFYVVANTLVTSGGAGVITFGVYNNGTLINSTTALTTVANGTLIDTGIYTAVGTTATTDVWSCRVSSTGTYTSGSIALTGSMIVGYNA